MSIKKVISTKGIETVLEQTVEESTQPNIVNTIVEESREFTNPQGYENNMEIPPLWLQPKDPPVLLKKFNCLVPRMMRYFYIPAKSIKKIPVAQKDSTTGLMKFIYADQQVPDINRLAWQFNSDSIVRVQHQDEYLYITRLVDTSDKIQVEDLEESGNGIFIIEGLCANNPDKAMVKFFRVSLDSESGFCVEDFDLKSTDTELFLTQTLIFKCELVGYWEEVNLIEQRYDS